MTPEPTEPSPSTSTATTITSPSRKTRQTPCTQCTLHPSIYTCPACKTRTCSLTCSNLHKQIKKCNGKRNRVEPILMNQYSWGSLMQDYTYLEDVHRVLTDSKKLGEDKNRFKKDGIRERIVRKALKEGVRLVLMADDMSRRKLNTTTHKPPKPNIMWTVEFLFFPNNSGVEEKPEPINPLTKLPENQSSSTRIHINSTLLHNISSATPIKQILSQAIRNKKLKLSEKTHQDLTEIAALLNNDDQVLSTKTLKDTTVLTLFIDPVTTQLSEQENGPTDSRTTNTQHFHMIKFDDSLQSALNGSEIVEWPIIKVWNLSDWEKQLSTGQVKIIDKKAIQLSKQNDSSLSGKKTGGCFSVRKSDSGWDNKRRKLNQVTFTEKQSQEKTVGPLVDYGSAESDED